MASAGNCSFGFHDWPLRIEIRNLMQPEKLLRRLEFQNDSCALRLKIYG